MMTRFQPYNKTAHPTAPGLLCLLALFLAAPINAWSQAVAVTLSLETNTITVGSNTVLHVSAQIVPNLRASSDRIFSWYIDVVNTNTSVAAPQYASMTRPASDNYPETSSAGFDDGPARRGIYDTFTDLNLPAPGRDTPVELLRVPVTGLAPGWTRLLVRAGTGVPELSEDFIVAPLGGGDPFTGGDYTTAFADLLVLPPPCEVRLSIAPEPAQPGWLRLSFTPCSFYNHVIEFRENLNPGTLWQALPGGPHNSGSALVQANQTQRYYRVRTTLQTGGTP